MSSKAQKRRIRRQKLRDRAEKLTVYVEGYGRFVYREDIATATTGARQLLHGARRMFDVLSTQFIACKLNSDEEAWEWALDKTAQLLAGPAGQMRRVIDDADTGEKAVQVFAVSPTAYNLGEAFAVAAFRKAQLQASRAGWPRRQPAVTTAA